jgi:3-isopropylmalate dehydratase small subunit
MDEAKGGNHVFAVDLAAQTVTAPSGRAFAFEIDPERKRKMLEGLDSIGETLAEAAAIDAYEARSGV